MSNMSYCRYENTLRDLQDCAIEMGERPSAHGDMSETERDAKRSLIDLCCSIAEEYGSPNTYSAEEAGKMLRS